MLDSYPASYKPKGSIRRPIVKKVDEEETDDEDGGPRVRPSTGTALASHAMAAAAGMSGSGCGGRCCVHGQYGLRACPTPRSHCCCPLRCQELCGRAFARRGGRAARGARRPPHDRAGRAQEWRTAPFFADRDVEASPRKGAEAAAAVLPSAVPRGDPGFRFYQRQRRLNWPGCAVVALYCLALVFYVYVRVTRTLSLGRFTGYGVFVLLVRARGPAPGARGAGLGPGTRHSGAAAGWQRQAWWAGALGAAPSQAARRARTRSAARPACAAGRAAAAGARLWPGPGAETLPGVPRGCGLAPRVTGRFRREGRRRRGVYRCQPRVPCAGQSLAPAGD